MSVSNMSKITSMFLTVAMFVIVYLQTTFYIYLLSKLMTCLHTKLHVPSSNGT
jgi:hypothetical protein